MLFMWGTYDIIYSDHCFSSTRWTLKLFYNMILLDLASATKEDSSNIALPWCHDIINVSFKGSQLETSVLSIVF